MDERPWEQQEGEPDRWWNRFDTYYRPLGVERTLSEAYRRYYEDRHNKPLGRTGYSTDWQTIYTEWKWKERAEAWDESCRLERLKQEKEKQVRMSQRHIESAQAVQSLALEQIIHVGFTDTPTALRAWSRAVEIERIAQGLPDHLVEIQEMTEEELNAKLAKQLARAAIHQRHIQPDETGEGNTSGPIDESRDGRDDSDLSRPELPDPDEVSE